MSLYRVNAYKIDTYEYCEKRANFLKVFKISR
ncbi:hypothetical protein XBFFL1_1640066 [Xenorhabdus bovienii str. feltiae Florida]|uniref:Uncharacterized protein n=1 Tax=Xenorhabdus bovienii str. kraussei Becker Underwood TaxID=1398204 RepID=A0A077PNG0_XENBV|nr:hypothetical protein XBFFR1_1990015 [Xenorhabdus bovienii str. feltiae France]CDG91554.1 hypothetical protein XBFFL1_1640066 [Xenorhabdus bovienii str. feltiae Florida]CDH22603.1 hypothetical protein XBKB1_1240040 [Xenorhabdus bovienii str. kraussei Becker Underwood]